MGISHHRNPFYCWRTTPLYCWRIWILQQGTAWQLAITVILSIFSEYFCPFTLIRESGLLFICIPILSVLKKFPGVSDRWMFVATFSSMLKNVPAVSRLILWALADDRLSAVTSCSFSFRLENILNSHFSSKPVCSDTNCLSVWSKTFVQTVWIRAKIFMVYPHF